MPAPGSAAAHSAAAAPVLAPKWPMAGWAARGLARSHLVTSAGRRGEQADAGHAGPAGFLLGGEQVAQERAQAGVVQHAGDMVIARLSLLPLPWAKATIPRAPSGTVR